MLRVEGLTKRFGGLVAVNGVSFEVPAGQVMSIVGPNGAGKTTVFNLITGVLPIDSGEVFLSGKCITGWPPHKLAAHGIGRTFQNIRLFKNLNALENVMIGRTARTRAGVLSALAATTCLFRANVGEIVSAPGARDVMERVLRSTIEIATREGHPPRPAAIEFARNGLTNPAGTSTASMLRDIEAGRPVESDHIIGWMLDKARRHGSDDTILALAHTHLKAYEARRLAGRLPDS